MVLTPLQCCCSLWKPRNHYQIKGLVTDPAHRLLPGLNVVRQAVFEFNLSGFNSPQLAAICFKGERSEGKNRVIPRQLAAGIAIFSLAVFIHKSIQRRVPIADRHRPLFVHALLRLDAATIQ